MPLLATHYYGKGQVLFVGFEESWRWRYNAADKYFARFWGQIIYQMALPHLLGNESKKVHQSYPNARASARASGENPSPSSRHENGASRSSCSTGGSGSDGLRRNAALSP